MHSRVVLLSPSYDAGLRPSESVMAKQLVIENDSGTSTGRYHPHNGYYAGDFSRPDSRRRAGLSLHGSPTRRPLLQAVVA